MRVFKTLFIILYKLNKNMIVKTNDYKFLNFKINQNLTFFSRDTNSIYRYYHHHYYNHLAISITKHFWSAFAITFNKIAVTAFIAWSKWSKYTTSRASIEAIVYKKQLKFPSKGCKHPTTNCKCFVLVLVWFLIMP